MISKRRKVSKDGMLAAFSGEAATAQKDTADASLELHTKIGQLIVEKDFLERAFAKRWVASEDMG